MTWSRGEEDERTRSLRARCQLLQGDLEGAGRWVDTFIDPPPDRALFWLEEPQVTRVSVLIARRWGYRSASALQILNALDEIADRTHDVRYKIEVLAFRALALDAQGETDQGLPVLKQSVELARPGGL